MLQGDGVPPWEEGLGVLQADVTKYLRRAAIASPAQGKQCICKTTKPSSPAGLGMCLRNSDVKADARDPAALSAGCAAHRCLKHVHVPTWNPLPSGLVGTEVSVTCCYMAMRKQVQTGTDAFNTAQRVSQCRCISRVWSVVSMCTRVEMAARPACTL